MPQHRRRTARAACQRRRAGGYGPEALLSRLAGEAEPGLPLVAALWRFWYVRGYRTWGQDHLEATLEAAVAEALAGGTRAG